MPGIGLVTNPRSRKNRRDPAQVIRLAYMLGNRGVPEATKSLEDLYRAAEAFKKERIDILAINGGDGTIHVTLSALIKTYGDDQPLPMVAILRGGTMNTIANSLGVKGETSELLFNVVDKYHTREEFQTVTKRVLKVGDTYGCIFGNGLIYNFLSLYYGTGKPSPGVAAQVLARGIFSSLIRGPYSKKLFRRFRAQITVDGQTWAREDFTTVAASCVEQIGLGFKPFYRVRENPDRFAVLGIHVPSALSMVFELPRIMRGLPMRRDKVIDAAASEVIFRSDEDLAYTVDGDTYVSGRELALTSGPPVRFIVS
jgi:diacylglycerol kinase family enzyme